MNAMKYGAYVARVEFDEDLGKFHARVINTSDVISFYGASVEELRDEFAASVEAHLDFCRRKGVAPSKPFSGQFRVRLTPEQHSKVSTAAALEGKSMNEWISDTLDHAAEDAL